MPNHIFRPNRISDERDAAETRDTITKSWHVLRERMPDTFLGRKTHEPFRPIEDIKVANSDD
jgi:hypothetical protein